WPRRRLQARLPRRQPGVGAQARRPAPGPSGAHAAADPRAPLIARVAVFAPVERTFDYRVPPALAAVGAMATAMVTVGTRVWVPFGGRALEGVVVAVDPPDAVDDPRPLSRLVDAPPVGGDLVALAAWVAGDYCAPPGEVMRLMLPA